MSDIFQEVEEDMRRERLKKAWDRYGIIVIGAAVLIVVITAGYRGYEAWDTSRKRNAGDQFAQALVQAEAARTVSAAEELTAFAQDAPSGFQMLAEFRAGTVYMQADQPEEARAIFDSLSRDSDIPAVYRDLARLRLSQTLLDLGQNREAMQAVSSMAEDANNPFNRSAQELMGLGAYAADDTAAAERWFTALRDAAGVPPGLQSRARFMLALIAQTSGLDSQTGSSSEGETN